MQVFCRSLAVLLSFYLPFQAVASAGVLERIKATKTLTIAYTPSSYPISFKGEEGRERLVGVGLDALAGDRMVLVGQVAAAGEPERFSILDTDFSLDPYAFAMPRNQADFRLSVNSGLAEIYRSGEIDRIFARWFGKDVEPTDLLRGIFFLYGFRD